MTSKRANLANRSVRYLEAGDGVPMILLHAFPLHADQWLPQLARVVPGWRLIAPDLRGFHGSPIAPLAVGDVSVDAHAADVLDLMNHLEIDRAVVGGLSMGGYVALAVYQAAASRVLGLVLADTRAAADAPEARAGRDRMLEALSREGVRRVADDMMPKLLGATTLREQPDLADALMRMMEDQTAEGMGAAIRALRDRPDRTSLLAEIACPTIVICGDEDTLTPPAVATSLRDSIPGSRLSIVPRAGHLSNIEAPALFNAALWQSGVFSALSR